jgi:hypothetical protein
MRRPDPSARLAPRIQILDRQTELKPRAENDRAALEDSSADSMPAICFP